MKYEIIIGFEWLPSQSHANLTTLPNLLWAERQNKTTFFSGIGPLQRGMRRLSAADKSNVIGSERHLASRVCVEPEDFSTMTNVLVRGAALAVMLLACSAVSDVLVRCPAVKLMVLAC